MQCEGVPVSGLIVGLLVGIIVWALYPAPGDRSRGRLPAPPPAPPADACWPAPPTGAAQSPVVRLPLLPPTPEPAPRVMQPPAGVRGRPQALAIKFEPEPNLLHVDGDLFSSSEMSPDGRYVAGIYPDAFGHDTKWSGFAILVDVATPKVLATVKCPYGRYVHVANTGRFIVEASGSDARTLSGGVTAFDSAGAKLWTKSFRAIPMDSSISPDGSTVTVQLANSDCEAQSGATYTIDGSTGSTLGRTKD